MDIITKLTALIDSAYDRTEDLDLTLKNMNTKDPDVLKTSAYCRDEVIIRMDKLREAVDEMEIYTASGFWPYPTYGDLMFKA